MSCSSHRRRFRRNLGAIGAIDLPRGKPVETKMMVYLGPKERGALRDAGNDLSLALIYSNYAILDLPAEYLLKFLGSAIAALTCSVYTSPEPTITVSISYSLL